ncbi:MAG: alpha/beta fold hydrolase [Candidatus Omnitrophica bacterium]|nr:alpha/beta fold hydrolase [Candidatus Omnitrophota bacterium]
MHTIFAYFFRPAPKTPLTRRRIELEDGDFLDIDFLEGRQDAPLVIIVHGLEGSSDARYVRGFLSKLHALGWQAACMNMRGCSGEPNRLKVSYHSGKTEDLDPVVGYVLKNCTMKAVYMVGFSIGGNLVLKWLGEKGGDAEKIIQKAASVSAPYDLVKAAEVLDRGLNRQIYTRKLLFTLKRKTFAKARQFPGLINKWKVRWASTFRAFDREVTSKINGFKDEYDYWKQSGCIHVLDKIRVPSLLVHADNDSFYPGKFFPHTLVDSSKYLHALITPTGGHLGFVSGSWPWKMGMWMEDRVIEFLKPQARPL